MHYKKCVLASRGFLLLLWVFLFLTLFLLTGCVPISDLLFGPSGSIEVSTYPSGAKIFLNGKETGHITPYTFINLPKRTYNVKVVLGDASFTKKVIVYAERISSVYVELYPPLNKITVKPASMKLMEGESKKIESVTAFYADSGSASLALSDCSYSSNSNHATVNSDGIITAVSEGTAKITVSYTDSVITESDMIDINVEALHLSNIEVLPSSMILDIGESRAISSIIANYYNYNSMEVALVDCIYSSDNACLTVDSDGIITGVSEGFAVVTISYTKNGITETDSIEIVVGDKTYRAFCVGVGDYENYDSDDGDLSGPTYDVDRIMEVFDRCRFGVDEIVFSAIESLKDSNATKSAIISGIVTTFYGADDNDVSYFYFSGHGSWDLATSYLCPFESLTNSFENDISVQELEAVLSNIPGIKVIILDSCFSGGFIGKGRGEKSIDTDKSLIEFNNDIMDVFITHQARELLRTSQYKVLTSAHYDQPCEEYPLHPIDNNPFGIFTAAFCHGCGYDDGNSYADFNLDNIISLNELYEHIRDYVIRFFGFGQNVQVFPDNSNYTVIEYYEQK